MPILTRSLTLLAVAAALGAPLSARAAAPTPPPRAAVILDPELKAALASAPKASQWPDHNYARLLDLESVTMKPDGTVVADYRETVKIFNERGRSVAEVNLPYNASYENLTVKWARTLKKDGRVLEVSPGDIRTSSAYSDYPMYGDSMSVGFSMPGVEDDCVIDYAWRQVTKPLLMPGYFWDFWAFSGTEPVSLSRYILKAPVGKKIQFRVYNNDSIKPRISTSPDGATKVYTWQATGMKPVDSEPAMPNRNEVQAWMEVSTISSWQDIASWFWRLAKPQAVVTPAMRLTEQQLIAGKTTDAEKATAIYDFVANHVRYVGLEFGLSAFKPHPAPDVFDKLYGDCKDKATLLVTMLGVAGIKAHPVLLRSEDKRSIDRQLPTLAAFDHCIAMAEIDGKQVWLDSTAETCGFGDIPASDRGAQGFVVDDGAGRFETIPVYGAAQNGFDSVTHVDLQPDGSARVSAETHMRGASAEQWRSYVRSITPDQRKQMIQAMAQSISVGGTVQEFKLPDGVDKRGPYIISMKLAAPTRAKSTKNLLILPLANTSGGSDHSNPFVKETRVWPIVVEEASLQQGETTITLPQGYTVEDTPADINLEGELFSYRRTITVSSDGRTINVKVASESKPGRVPAADYAMIRRHYDRVISATEDVIVIRKPK